MQTLTTRPADQSVHVRVLPTGRRILSQLSVLDVIPKCYLLPRQPRFAWVELAYVGRCHAKL